MDRREMLKVAAGGIMLATAGNAALAAEGAKQPGSHEHMHNMPRSGNKNQSLIDAASDSVKKGQACLSHGLEIFSQGENKAMAICAMRVSDMIAACAAIGQLASNNSSNLGKMAKVVMDVCKDCETECRKFKDEEICMRTAESCAACFNECKKIAV
ncbi:MAG: four-helix bundle copper-binding protein [Nitrosomonadales bacterium]|nr:four-helix bundle copper-binding protein [Nitrosomonadales bacterium]